MTSFGQVLRGLDWSYLTDLLQQLIPALLCIMIHEICHGAAAYALGDRTAATQGRTACASPGSACPMANCRPAAPLRR